MPGLIVRMLDESVKDEPSMAIKVGMLREKNGDLLYVAGECKSLIGEKDFRAFIGCEFQPKENDKHTEEGSTPMSALPHPLRQRGIEDAVSRPQRRRIRRDVKDGFAVQVEGEDDAVIGHHAGNHQAIGLSDLL